MRQLARQLEKAEAKHGQETERLSKLKAKMEKMQGNCSHSAIEMKNGIVVCKDCLAEVAYAKGGADAEEDDFEYEE